MSATGIIKLVTGYLPKLFSGTTKRKRAMPVLKKRPSLLGTTKRKRVLKNVAKHAGAAIGAGVTGAAIGAGAGFLHWFLALAAIGSWFFVLSMAWLLRRNLTSRA